MINFLDLLRKIRDYISNAWEIATTLHFDKEFIEHDKPSVMYRITQSEYWYNMIHFKKMTLEDIPLWLEWSYKPHVKDVWFIDGYETRDYIQKKIEGNGYDYPFIIEIDSKPIGYIVTCDLYAYRELCVAPKGLFTQEEKGTFCMDLFIADESYLNKGYGTQIVKLFIEKILKKFKANIILIDPAVSNKRAIRCYEKVGFRPVKTAFDGITECLVMKLEKQEVRNG